jgi:FKBP-type peptidyl-prolyl cis-trans isomerase FklB
MGEILNDLFFNGHFDAFPKNPNNGRSCYSVPDLYWTNSRLNPFFSTISKPPQRIKARSKHCRGKLLWVIREGNKPRRKGVKMKLKSIVAWVLGILFLTSLASAAEDTALKDQKDKVSYSIGVNIGNSLKTLPVEVNLDLIIKGIRDMVSGTPSLMTDQEIRETMTAFQKEVTAKYAEKMKALGEKNKKEGEAFLAENKKKEGVTTLPDGLQYKVLTAGAGKKPTDADSVTVQYRGTLIDGTEFDSSFKRGQPATFPVKGVIPGWTEALKLMQPGAKWQIFIPSQLAYGERGAGNQIGPNATLIFEVELISIQEKQEKKDK